MNVTEGRDGLVSLRARVRPELITALVSEATARCMPPGRLLSELLADALPDAAADRVRHRVAPACALRLVATEAVEGPAASARGGPS